MSVWSLEGTLGSLESLEDSAKAAKQGEAEASGSATESYLEWSQKHEEKMSAHEEDQLMGARWKRAGGGFDTEQVVITTGKKRWCSESCWTSHPCNKNLYPNNVQTELQKKTTDWEWQRHRKHL